MNIIRIEEYSFIGFDFDGVILNTIKMKADGLASLYCDRNRREIEYVYEYQLSHGGQNRFDKFRHFEKKFTGCEPADSRLKTLSEQFTKFIMSNVAQCPFVSGVSTFIENLHISGCKVCIASAMPKSDLDMILDTLGINHWFAIALGSPAPKVDNLISIKKRFASGCKKGLYFGDNMSDFTAASSAEVDFIGVATDERFSSKQITHVKNFEDFKIV